MNILESIMTNQEKLNYQNKILDAIKSKGFEATEKQFFTDQNALTIEGHKARRVFGLLYQDELGNWNFSKK